ncbi:MAG: hypothetical protein WCU88_12920 [Elusimicrobiota bacterium]|jgi:hypothetical protein
MGDWGRFERQHLELLFWGAWALVLGFILYRVIVWKKTRSLRDHPAPRFATLPAQPERPTSAPRPDEDALPV